MSPISLSKYCFPMNHDREKNSIGKGQKAQPILSFQILHEAIWSAYSIPWPVFSGTMYVNTFVKKKKLTKISIVWKLIEKQKYLCHIVIADFGLYQLQTLPLAGMFGNPKLYSRNKKTTDLWTHKDTPSKPTPSLRAHWGGWMLEAHVQAASHLPQINIIQWCPSYLTSLSLRNAL